MHLHNARVKMQNFNGLDILIYINVGYTKYEKWLFDLYYLNMYNV